MNEKKTSIIEMKMAGLQVMAVVVKAIMIYKQK